jgi:hypothetical protein
MGFGRNPHAAKAEAAEQKALGARDDVAAAHAWREAGRLWERASDRETDAKRKAAYAAKAERARAFADAPRVVEDPGGDPPPLDDAGATN